MFQINSLRARGQHFLDVPDSYYDNLREQLSKAKIHVKEDIDTVSSETFELNRMQNFSSRILSKTDENLCPTTNRETVLQSITDALFPRLKVDFDNSLISCKNVHHFKKCYTNRLLNNYVLRVLDHFLLTN